MSKKLVEYNGAVLEVELYKAGKPKIYDAYLIEGSWPTIQDLIILCDGGCPDFPEEAMCKGGCVENSDKKPT